MNVEPRDKGPRLRSRAAVSNLAGSLILQGGLRAARLISLLVAAYLLPTTGLAVLAVALALTDIVRAALQAFDVAAVRVDLGDGPVLAMRALTTAKLLAAIALGGLAVVLGRLIYGAEVSSIVLVLMAGLVCGSLASLWMVPAQRDLRLLSMTPEVLAASLVTTVAATAGAVTHAAVMVAAGLVLGDVVLLLLIARKVSFRPDLVPSRIRSAFAESPRLMVQQLGYVGQFRLGTLVLAFVAAPLAVAEYTVASRLAEGLVVISVALAATSYPLMARAFGTGGRPAVLERFVPSYWVAIGTAAITVLCLVVTEPVWLPLLVPKYPGVAVPFAVVGIGVVFYFASAQTTSALNALRHDSAAAAAAILGLVANVIGLALLAGPMGAIGVAFARLIGEAARSGAEGAAIWANARRSMRNAWVAWLAFTPLIAAIVVIVIADWDVRVTLAASVLGGATTLLGVREYWPSSHSGSSPRLRGRPLAP